MADQRKRDRIRLALVVWGVLLSQVFLYPGLEDTVVALGGGDDILAGMWFLVAEFAAFVVCAVLWGIASDALGRRTPLVVLSAAAGGASYLVITQVPALGLGFEVVLLLRVLGGAATIGAFSLSITMLMDLSGGHGRNMGAAGMAIGLGAAVGSVTGGQLASFDPLAPLYGGAAVLGAVALLAATVTDRAPGEGTAMNVVAERVRSRPGLLVPFAFGFIDRMTAGFFALAGVWYFRDTFEIGAAQAGFTLALFFVPFALFQYPMGSLSDRIGRSLPMIGGSICFGVTIIGVGLAGSYPLAAGGMILVGICGAAVLPATMALVTDLVPAEERGAAMGGFNVFGSLGFMAGFVVGAVVTDIYGYLLAFLVVGGLEIAIALVAFRTVRRMSEGFDPRTRPDV